MADLFSPLALANLELANRLVMAPTPSGLATADGFASAELAAYYAARAAGGIGLIISEPMLVVPPLPEAAQPALGLYADAFVPGLYRCARAVHGHGGALLFSLEAPAAPAQAAALALAHIREQFVLAAWRALAAGADGVMLSAVDGGLLHALLSPLRNTRSDSYGGSVGARLRLAQEIVEEIRNWTGKRLLVGFRLAAEELAPGGMNLHDARVVARRMVSAGVRLFDVTVLAEQAAAVATFPGWSAPLANGIKRIAPEVPVICADPLDDALLADSLVRDGSVDLVTVDGRDPAWPTRARRELDGYAPPASA